MTYRIISNDQVVCNYCGTGDLRWGMGGKKRRILTKEGRVHVCYNNRIKLPEQRRLRVTPNS